MSPVISMTLILVGAGPRPTTNKEFRELVTITCLSLSSVMYYSAKWETQNENKKHLPKLPGHGTVARKKNAFLPGPSEPSKRADAAKPRQLPTELRSGPGKSRKNFEEEVVGL
jgi:hypothetical protein